jgi:hypothetical protein
MKDKYSSLYGEEVEEPDLEWKKSLPELMATFFQAIDTTIIVELYISIIIYVVVGILIFLITIAVKNQ